MCAGDWAARVLGQQRSISAISGDLGIRTTTPLHLRLFLLAEYPLPLLGRQQHSPASADHQAWREPHGQYLGWWSQRISARGVSLSCRLGCPAHSIPLWP